MKIFIKGFKSIAEGQYVAIGKKLTFLVGPNSAGKSVVYHALSKLQSGNPQFGLDASALHYNGTRNEYALQQSLGVEWVDGDDVLESRVSYLLGSDYEDYEDALSNSRANSGQVYSSELDYDEISSHVDVNEIKIKNKLVECEARFSSKFQEVNRAKRHLLPSLYYAYNNNHNILSINDNFKGVGKACDFILKLSSMGNYVDSKDNFRKFFFDFFNNGYKSGFLWWDPFFIRLIIEDSSFGKERQQLLNQFFHHDAVIRRRIEKINNEYISKNPLKSLKLVLVSADRVLPRSEDVRCTVSEDVPKNIYHALARSFVERDWGFSYFNNKYIENFTEGVKGRRNLADRVNDALANDLFIDNGYQVHVSSSLILPRIGVDYFLKNKGEVGGGDFNAKIELMDSHGRILSFDQVGSGIGYVLPVLVEALNSENAGAMVFLQQPELHLHPAMQASLSDVLIDAAADKRILVETHSEHMILRALKRVRQTFNETLMEENLRLTYEDVAVNYFEPQGDGTTKVHIIRVAPDGEFIDRWPHGFFAERDQELFDE